MSGLTQAAWPGIERDALDRGIALGLHDHTTVVEDPGGDALACREARQVSIKALRHAGSIGDDEACFLNRPRRAA